MIQFRLPAEAAQYALFQRTALLPVRRFNRVRSFLARFGMGQSYEDFVRDYAGKNAERIAADYGVRMEERAAHIAGFLPADTRSLLDIGCGIAALDLFLYRRLPRKPRIHLLDRTAVEDRVFYMFEEKGAFYNSLELARQTLEENGVPGDRIATIEAPEDGRLPLPNDSIDAVISTLSWGFHYPIQLYSESVHAVLTDGGVVVVDVRKDTDGPAELKRLFAKVEEVDDIGKAVTLKCTK